MIYSLKILIFDEFFVGFDLKVFFILKEIMREFCDKGGCIFFLIYVLEVVEKICDKIVIIKDGNIIVYGIIEEVKGSNLFESIFMELIEK